ncbi:MAG: hypothetical protein ACPL0A_02535 [Candidatus Micrarchaeia archaeon]
MESTEKRDLKGVLDAINEGADVNAKNRFGQTAYDLAASKGYDEIVAILTKADDH